MSTSIVAGSIAAMAGRTGRSIAEQLLDAEHVVLVDVSPSMEAHDSRGERERLRVAQEELARLQAEFPGKLAVYAFAGECRPVPGGVPAFLPGLAGSGTDLAGALRTVKRLDGLGLRFVVISDGEPNSEHESLTEARAFTSPISTIFVGPEGGSGQDFLRRLATAAGGTAATANRVMTLADTMRPLLTAGAPA